MWNCFDQVSYILLFRCLMSISEMIFQSQSVSHKVTNSAPSECRQQLDIFVELLSSDIDLEAACSHENCPILQNFKSCCIFSSPTSLTCSDGEGVCSPTTFHLSEVYKGISMVYGSTAFLNYISLEGYQTKAGKMFSMRWNFSLKFPFKEITDVRSCGGTCLSLPISMS